MRTHIPLSLIHIFKTKILSRELGVSRLSFGQEEYIELMSIKPGSVSVLGVLNDRDNRVRLLIDREVYEDDYICLLYTSRCV